MLNVTLTAQDFDHLVRGGTLKIGSRLQVALADIGFPVMDATVQAASKSDARLRRVGMVQDIEETP